MRKVFYAYALSGHATDSGAEAFLNLPAYPYEMLDAIDKLRLSEGGDIKFRVDEYYRFGSLMPFLSEPNDLYALNALAQKLSELDDQQEVAFEGLLMEYVVPYRSSRVFHSLQRFFSLLSSMSLDYYFFSISKCCCPALVDDTALV